MQWPTVPQAARLMGISRAQAWRRLKALQEAHEGFEVLRSYARPGKRTGRFLVNPDALRDVLRRERTDSLENLDQRVGSLETLVEVMRIQIRQLKQAKRSGETERKLADLERRLVSLGCI